MPHRRLLLAGFTHANILLNSIRAYRMRLDEWGVKKNNWSTQNGGHSGLSTRPRGIYLERGSMQQANLAASSSMVPDGGIFSG
jgi:hypothetical protein